MTSHIRSALWTLSIIIKYTGIGSMIRLQFEPQIVHSSYWTTKGQLILKPFVQVGL